MKIRKYLSQILIIFISVMAAFIAEDWRDNRQDLEKFDMILYEIKKNIQLDSIEIYGDMNRLQDQINIIDQLLKNDPHFHADSMNYYLSRIMFIDWPDYVLTGFEQLKNSKIISNSLDDELLNLIYEYYQWVNYHNQKIGPTISGINNLQEYLIDQRFYSGRKDTLTEYEANSIRDLLMDTEFIIRLKYLSQDRNLELRIYQTMRRKSDRILDMFNKSS
jgi:hypothetical protein